MSRSLTFAACCATVGWVLQSDPVFSHNPTTTTVLFNREISAIFQQKCLSCHVEGAMAMPLSTYAEARPWAVAIKEEILARRMPPWPAERGYGDFANDTGLTTREMDFLISWVEGGAPSGEGDAPPYADHRGHWMLGEPDVLGSPREGVQVPAESAAQFRRVIVDPGASRERWIRAIDFKPGDTRVVRAAFFSVAETKQYLGGWTPGATAAATLPDGAAFRLPAKGRIAVDILYRGTNETVVDRPRVALYFAAAPPPIVLGNVVLPSSTSGPQIVSDGRIRAETTLASDQTLWGLRPELPPAARSIEVTARRPDGSLEVLLWVKAVRQEWQTPYVFRRPIRLPKGTVLRAMATMDGPAADTGSRFVVTFVTHAGMTSATTAPVQHVH